MTRFLADRSGATAIEYGLLCALLALFILSAVHTTGATLIAKLNLLLDAFM